MISWSRASSARATAARRTFPRCTSAVIGSPRFSRALPPSATTTRMSASYGGDENRLDGMHAVLRLVEDDGSIGLEDLFADFHAVDTELLIDFLGDLGLPVMEGRQAVHELRVRVAGGGHDTGGNTVGGEQLDPLLPH